MVQDPAQFDVHLAVEHHEVTRDLGGRLGTREAGQAVVTHFRGRGPHP